MEMLTNSLTFEVELLFLSVEEFCSLTCFTHNRCPFTAFYKPLNPPLSLFILFYFLSISFISILLFFFLNALHYHVFSFFLLFMI